MANFTVKGLDKLLNDIKIDIFSKVDSQLKKQKVINYFILALLVISIFVNFMK